MNSNYTSFIKQISIGLFLFSFCITLHAIYVENHPITVKQPDGTDVHCFASGDEFYNWVHDANGYTLIRDPQTGIIVYAKLENDELISTGYRVASIDPATIGLQPRTIISVQKRQQLRTNFLKNIPKPDGEKLRDPAKGGWNNGTLNNIVVYIRFSDEDEFSAEATYNDLFNKDEPGKASMYGYFKAVSYGKTFIPSTFYPASEDNTVISYQDIYPRSYFQPYGPTNPNGYQDYESTEREHQLLKRALEFIKDEIPEDLDLDFNDDGYVDNICFVVRGDAGAWASLLWPHRWVLYTEEVYIHGKRVWDFNLIMEDFLNGSRQVSVLSHEMFHTLGAPDLYRYADNTIDPVGSWDLMCGDSPPSQSTNIWMKHRYGGWVEDIPEISERGEYTLHNVWSETNNAYKIPSPNSSTEFFIIEYRDNSIFWDSNTPGSGLIIYRVDQRDSGYGYPLSGNAGGPPDEVYIFRPGGTGTLINGNINNAYFSNQKGRTNFNDASNPPCFLSNNQPGGISICKIGNSGEETMKFEINYATLNVDPMTLNFGNVAPGTTSEPLTITVSGSNLCGDITYIKEGTHSNYFKITPNSWDPATGGALNVTFSPNPIRIYNATLTIRSDCALYQKITLTGNGAINIDEQTDASVKIYPNPTTGILTIETENESMAQVFSVEGRLLLEQNINMKGKIDLSAFANGLYLVKMEDKNRNTVVTKTIMLDK